MTNTISVPRALVRRLWLALAGGVSSFAIATIQGIVREGDDPWQQGLSALRLGPTGWIQMLNLIAFGTIVLTTVPTWRQILAEGTGSTAYPATFERGGIVVPMLWPYTFLRGLRNRAPFMVAPRAVDPTVLDRPTSAVSGVPAAQR